MLSGKRGLAAVVLLLCSTRAAVSAVSVQYTVVPVGGNVYQYTYSLTNSGSGPAVQLFDILFDTSLYDESSLLIVTAPPLNTQWSQQILHSVPPSLPGSYTALALAGGVPAGSTVTGFAVRFAWLGSGVPGPQPFQIFDPTSGPPFALLQTSTTTQGAISVPTASNLSLTLLGLGLAAATAFQGRLRLAESATR